MPAYIFWRWKEESGTVILDGIGSTEALHIFISNHAEDIKAGSSGLMVAGYNTKIINDNGKQVSQGEEDSLLIQGDSICKYYWNNPEKLRKQLTKAGSIRVTPIIRMRRVISSTVDTVTT